MVKMICSGAQTGADLGGLLAAKKLGIPTGGWMPKDCMTELGSKREFLKEYNLWESNTGYVGRTYANAKLGDGTIRFSTNWSSPGEVCTLNAIKKYSKPHIDVDPREPLPFEDVVRWIKEHNIEVLNVAGNRESKSPGIQKFVEEYLTEVLK